MTTTTTTKAQTANEGSKGVVLAPKAGVPSSTPSMSLVSLMSNAGTSAGSKRKLDETPATAVKKARRRWKKPKGKPKRPLSAYNLYFKAERERMLRDGENVKLGFRDMAKLIAAKWNNLPQEDRAVYEGPAKEERSKYFTQLAAWKKEQQQKQKDEAFDKQMESLYDAFSGCTDGAGDSDEPLPVVSEPISTLSMDSPTIPTDTVTKPPQNPLVNSLQMASDLSNDTLKLACESSPLDESFDLFGSKSGLHDDDILDDMSLANPAMQRILKSCDALNSSIDNEFLDFMSSLDWNATPLETPSLDIQ